MSTNEIFFIACFLLGIVVVWLLSILNFLRTEKLLTNISRLDYHINIVNNLGTETDKNLYRVRNVANFTHMSNAVHEYAEKEQLLLTDLEYIAAISKLVRYGNAVRGSVQFFYFYLEYQNEPETVR